MAHPGELDKAKKMCTSVQIRLLNLSERMTVRGQPQAHVVSSVHTDMDAFIRSQPTVQLSQGACSVQQSSAHVLNCHFHCYQVPSHILISTCDTL